MTSNQTPANCLTNGHCVSPDDTTDTCMRCGDKTTGLDPAIHGRFYCEGDTTQEKTLRDEMAMAALQGLLASETKIEGHDRYYISRLSYKYADAMMISRRTPTERE